MNENIVVVRIRGGINLKSGVKDTLKMLNLHKQNYCTIIKNNSSNVGMVKKVKDFVTWGEIDTETMNALEKRQEKTKDKDGKEVIKKYYRLNPPQKGYGRKGIKVQFNTGGALGYRAEKINDLVKRMI